ncbi:unannotated protein [freshwater metagenome]|uniref:Unannotated protein n=1 Tax=freshwater metagenome TaxID=449393 RepID=A0A6J7HH01_9ZZZZ
MIGGHITGQCFIGQHEAVSHDVGRDIEDVLGQRVGAAPQQRECPTGANETKRRARARAEADQLAQVVHAEGGRFAGGENQIHRVVDDPSVDVHRIGCFLESLDEVGVEDLARHRCANTHAFHDRHLLGRSGVADDDFHEEAVALRFGQRVHTLALDRVLRGEHEERIGCGEGAPADRDLLLGHDLEQCRLHLRRRAVDLIGQDEVGKHRTQLDVKRLGGRPVDTGTDDVGRQEVGGELQAGERSAAHPGERLDGERLRDTGYALEEAVATREQAHHQPFDDPVLADDHLLDLEEGRFDDL